MSTTNGQLRAAVNVDVDGLYLYERIHGVAGTAGNVAGFDAANHDARAWTRGVPRFLDLFARAGVRATFFVVAQDVAHPDVRAVLADVVGAGHEIGSHSLSHPYDLSRLSAVEQLRELTTARQVLQDTTSQPIVGFRAPGYVLSPALLQTIVAAGHSYDSSRFPCPPYQLAKAAAIALYRLTGTPSGSVAEPLPVWFGPRLPYRERLGEDKTLIELPIGVVPGLRWPVIGTAAIVAGELGRMALAPALERTDWVNFELHAVDLLDFSGDNLPPLLRKQPDQRVALRHKWPTLLKTLEHLAATHRFATLAEHATAV